ncbi:MULTISPECIES: hypothetical protein [unclassified Streptomyces]|uniref:hypothetical protein n=1 Tax=unclassified Streptomyces TaxID=2593676 RepID=UPI00093BBC54|nr:hypothetical protein [Streptomyces sp. TSRI0281]OKI46193.1 hypothetical protein A6A29_28995 [Streptomyces sp. TSRI0281]
MTDAQPLVLACTLLDALEPLPYHRRMRELAVRAEHLAADGVLRPVLEELAGGDPYERHLAVVAAAVARDTGWIEDRIADEDPRVRGVALRVAHSLGVPDTAYEAALDDAPAAVRRQLIRAIVADRRTALADRLIEPLRGTWGDAEASRLLPGCSSEVVDRLLPELFRSVSCWSSLGTRHPRPFLDAAERDLASRPRTRRDAWWQWYGHERGVAAAVATHPHRVLDLLERYGPSALPVRRRLGELLAADPVRFARLFLGPEGFSLPRGGVLSKVLLRRLARTVPEELFVELGRSVADFGDLLAGLVLALPPGRRGAFYDAVVEGRGDGASGTVDTMVLDALPRSHVAPVARRMAARARDRGAGRDTVLLAESYLPVAEVRERLLAATRRPAADDRAEAWSLLIRNAGRSADPAAVATVLDDMLRLRNEQDPVRSAALRALLTVPPALCTDAVEPLLDRIATDAVEARDSSAATRSALSALAVGVLREHAVTGQRALLNWALRTLVRISGNSGSADLGRLDRTLGRGQEHTVLEALRPWLEAGAERSDYGLVLALARAVGRRAATMPELQEMLRQAVLYGNSSTARTAIGFRLEPPAHRDERVESILTRDPSAIALPAVRQVLTGRRTDLLDRFLGETPPWGRFLAAGTPWTVPVDNDVIRWVPRQHRAAGRDLERVVRDEKLPLYSRASALGQLARLPGIGADAVRPWTGSADIVLAEAALAALARTDRPAEVLPGLLAHTGDDRARVAVYAAGRVSLFVRPSLLAESLATRMAPGTGKVTSRKEAVRLAALRLPTTHAAGLLAHAYALPDQHPDVRAACVAFGVPLLDDERMWDVLADAASGAGAPRSAVLRAHPAELAAGHRQRYAGLVQQVCDTDDEELAALAHHAVARWLPWAPGACDVLVGALTDLDRRGTWRSAADALIEAAMAVPEAVDALNRVLTALATDDTADEAGAERDRPARQRVVYVAEALGRRIASRGPRTRAVLGATGEVLAGFRDFVPQAAGLLAHAVDLDADAEPLYSALVRLAGLHHGRPVLAARTALSVGRRAGAADGPAVGGLDTLLVVTARLTGSGDPAEGLFAAGLTVAGGRRTGWTGPWRTQLRMLRQHPVADVRDVAYAEVTARE